MVPVTNKLMRTTFVGGPGGRTRQEVWGCESLDGVWCFEREESVGTPWLVWHVPTRRMVSMHGSLAKARRFVARYGEAEDRKALAAV